MSPTTSTSDPLRPRRAPLDRRLAAHLASRSGFGAPPAEIERILADGLDRSVERLLEPVGNPEFDSIQREVGGGGVETLRAWWVGRMLSGIDPLREKLALFWHGHFATSAARVDDARLMANHLRLFLDLGRGRFCELLGRVANDEAMLLWLDAEKNRRDHPNENFARELFELFTLGRSNYTERDIREAARAFTGWRRARGVFEFVPSLHDDGPKQVFGRRGRFDADDILDLACSHPACPRFLTRAILRFFALEDPPADVVEALARGYASRDLDTGWLLGTLFRSEWFFREENVGTHILSPAEFVVGHLRNLGVRAGATAAAREIARLGQDLLRPPSVKGWDSGIHWIDTVTAARRLEFAFHVARGPAGDLVVDRAPFARYAKLRARADALVHAVAADTLRTQPPSDVMAGLAEDVSRTPRDERVARAVLVVLSLPEASMG